MMSESTRIVRRVVRVACRFGSAIEALSAPWLLLGCRLWLGQIVLIRQVVAMMTSPEHAPAGATGYALTSWGLESSF
jgi:hypothetical protein